MGCPACGRSGRSGRRSGRSLTPDEKAEIIAAIAAPGRVAGQGDVRDQDIPIPLTDAWRQFLAEHGDGEVPTSGSALQVGGRIMITVGLETLLGISSPAPQRPWNQYLEFPWDDVNRHSRVLSDVQIVVPPGVTEYRLVAATIRLPMVVVDRCGVNGKGLIAGCLRVQPPASSGMDIFLQRSWSCSMESWREACDSSWVGADYVNWVNAPPSDAVLQANWQGDTAPTATVMAGTVDIVSPWLPREDSVWQAIMRVAPYSMQFVLGAGESIEAALIFEGR